MWIVWALGIWAFGLDIIGGIFSCLPTGFRHLDDDFGILYTNDMGWKPRMPRPRPPRGFETSRRCTRREFSLRGTSKNAKRGWYRLLHELFTRPPVLSAIKLPFCNSSRSAPRHV